MTAQAKHFADNYEPIFEGSLLGVRTVLPADSVKRCRFCKKAPPNATFKKEAHAVPQLLGNKALISPNECDDCNAKFGETYESSLGKATLFERAVCGMRKRKGQPTHDDDCELRIGWAAERQSIVIKAPELLVEVAGKEGPFSLTVPLSTVTLPFVPIDAAKAFVKVACSLCPPNLVTTIERTIDWLAGRAAASMTYYPVLTSFTPGENPYGNGRALLLKRTNDQSLPFLWCIVASRNYRYQFFVPFCSEDDQWVHSHCCNFQTFHYPNWLATSPDYDVIDLANDREMQRKFDAKLNVLEGELKGRTPS